MEIGNASIRFNQLRESIRSNDLCKDALSCRKDQATVPNGG
jgi:hypothetical protein